LHPGSDPFALAPNDAPAEPPPADVGLPSQIGRFQIRARLGEGAFGTVYRAYDPQLEREVALKVARPGTLDSPKRVERFLGDARTAAQLRHPHIVPVYDAGQDGGFSYIASAFVPGRTLGEAADEGALDFRRSAQVVRALAEALAYAHDLGIVHRDVKPSNVMLDDKGQPHLIDFGLAHRQDTVEKRTRDGAVLGTPAYMAPEQAAGQKGVPLPASDQYSLGVVLYDLLCRQTPFSGPPQIVLFNAIHHEPPAPRRLRTDIPPDLETICLKALAKRPEDRYPGCRDLAEDLRRWLEGEPIRARRLGLGERLLRWCKRQPGLAAALGVAALALGGVAALAAGYALSQAEADRRLRAENQRADAAAEEARLQRLRAEKEKRRTREHRRQADRDAALLTLARGQGSCEEGDTGLGMLHLLRSLELAQRARDSALEVLVRRNLAAWRRRVHSLRVVYSLPTEVLAAAFSPDGNTVVLGCADGTARFWAVTGGKPAGKSLSHPRAVRSVAFSRDGRFLLTGCADRVVRLWDLKSGEAPRQFQGHTEAVNAVALSADGRHAASAGADRVVLLWDLKGKPKPRVLKGHSQEIHGVAFSPKGDLLLTGSADGTSRLWSVETGREVYCYPDLDPVRAVAFRPDGAAVLLGCGSLLRGEAQLWQVKGKRLATLPHQSEVLSVAFSPAGCPLTGGQDRSARLWNRDAAAPVGRPLWHPRPVRGVAFHPAGRSLLTVCEDRAVRLWHVAEDRPRREFTRDQVTALALGPGGKIALLAVATSDTDAEVWEVSPGRPAGRPLELPDPVSALASVKKGRLLLTGSEDGSVKLWDTPTGRPVKEFAGHSARVFRLAVSPDGKFFVSASFDGTALLWDMGDKTARALPHQGRGRVYAVAFSPDGRGVLTGGADKACRLWDVGTGQPLRSFAHPDTVLSVALSQDGRSLLTGYEGGAQLWEPGTGKRLGPALPHRTGVLSVAFSSDGRTLLTGGTDGTARLWDRATQKPVGPALKHPSTLFAAAFAGDGRAFVTAGLHTGSGVATFRTWELAAPVQGTAGRLELWVQSLTGMRLTEEGEVHTLAAGDWEKNRTRMRELGGPPAR
jgi:WD40 repeat protein/tRNA A-37 threonylcarbamoyl transferase component Bud32